MPDVKAMVTGRGTLKFGDSSSALTDFAIQVTEASITTSEKEGDMLEVLSGDTLTEESTYTYKLKGSALPNFTSKGLQQYSWAKKGKIVFFEFSPATADGAKFAGKCKITPMDVGGKVGKADTVNFEFTVIGDPTVTAATKVGGVAP